MKRRSGVKRFFLKCWMRLADFLKWVEKHPWIDRVVLFIVKIILFIMTHK